MSKINDGGPAFPVDVFSNEGGEYIREGGMTLRDYFAAKAMQAIVSHDPTFVKQFLDLSAQDAYAYADAMLKAREQS